MKGFLKSYDKIAASISFVIAAITYFLTVAPTASYWDCPEYIATAFNLEIGHPPGNPAWSLICHIFSMIAPRGSESLWINLSSGLFTAIAMALCCRIAFAITFTMARKLFPSFSSERQSIISAISALSATLILTWCDSIWFSAVEAEVYALSLMLSALSIWLIVRFVSIKGSSDDAKSQRQRLLILSAYIIGLSMGVHQLNLLVIPALALIILCRFPPKRHFFAAAIATLLGGCCIIMLLLAGLMPGSVELACQTELLCVNTLHQPYNSGIYLYLSALIILSILSFIALNRESHSLIIRVLYALIFTSIIFASGIFMLSKNIFIALILSAIAGFAIELSHGFLKKSLSTSLYMLVMIIVGFSVYLIIPIRAAAMPPLNEATPATPFDFRAYLLREQYGTPKSLIKGPTPFSRPLLRGTYDSDSTPVYRRYVSRKRHPIYRRLTPGMTQNRTSGHITANDSIVFSNQLSRNKDAYLLTDYAIELVDIPELNGWFSRMHDNSPDDLRGFKSWGGLDSASMVEVEISETIDSLGNPVGKLMADGSRKKGKALKPRLIHNLCFFATYQAGYMYFRYLLWNFSGRQNDIHSTGEIDHGNFITGFDVIDNAMLGPQKNLPPEASTENPGHNVYFMIPFLLAIIGIITLSCSGKCLIRLNATIAVLFLLTGLAIVVYLNQSLGEPRERDYSFLGSYMAFTFWIAAGVTGLCKLVYNLLINRRININRIFYITASFATLSLIVPLQMLSRNFDDHDRSNLTATTDFAINILNSLDPEAIIIVDGDNLTFPLWYAQEVLGVRRDVRVVNSAYLSQPDYILQLMTPAYTSPAIKMAVPPVQIKSGKFALTYYHSTDSIPPINAIEALTELYSSNKFSPEIKASHLKVPTHNGEELIISLRDVASNKTSISRRQLIILDIITSNYNTSRPLYIISHLGKSYYSGFLNHSSPELLAQRLNPTINQNLRDSLNLNYSTNLRYGGFELQSPPYADMTTFREASFLRSSLLRLARRRLDSGHKQQAYNLAKMALEKIPVNHVALRNNAYLGKIYEEPKEAVLILIESASTSEERNFALSLLRNQIKRAGQWEKYINALPANRRNAVSASSRSIAYSKKSLEHLSDSLTNSPLSANIVNK